MNDLISRQAAIDSFWKLDIEMRPSAIDAITGILEQLPSAQHWIPCSERLPDGRLNKSYLVQDKDGRRAVGTYTNWGWTFGHYMNDPVAWMSLPEPYKGEEA